MPPGLFASTLIETLSLRESRLKILRAIDRLSMGLSLLSGIALGCMALLIVAEIFLRKFAGISLHYVWEVSVFAHMAAVFLGAGWTLRTGGHIRVTLLLTKLPRLGEWVATLFGLAISGFMSSALIKLAWTYFASGRTSGSVTDTPLAIPATIIAFGASMMTLQILLRAVRLAIGEAPDLDTTGEDAPAPIMD